MKKIEKIEKILNAKYVNSIKPGHMGSSILRFMNNTNNMFVVKFAPIDNPEAIEDLNSNLYGYAEIRKIGASKLLPLNLKKIKLGKEKAIVMKDLGETISIKNEGIATFDLIWKNYKDLIYATITSGKINSTYLPLFVVEVIKQIERFAYKNNILDILDLIKKADWKAKRGEKKSIMLLDFTPNNLFINGKNLSFIDPWHQSTYLGNPAVSIGQFATLAKLNKMKDSNKAFIMFKKRCLKEIPVILGGNTYDTELAFRLGSTLQFILSSYVRRESNPSLADKLLIKAHLLWTKK